MNYFSTFAKIYYPKLFIMKKFLILVQVIGLALLIACKSGGTGKGSSPEQPFGEESGIVTYKAMEISGVKVTQTMYFDDYGKKETHEMLVVGIMMDVEMRQHSIEMRDGNIAYRIELENMAGGQDQAQKTAYKTTLTPELFDEMSMVPISAASKTKLDYKEEGKETIAGLEGVKFSVCPDSTNPQNRISGVHYKNILLKITLPQIEIIAEKVELGVKVPADKFKVPEGYTVVEQPVGQSLQTPAEAPAEATEENDTRRR